MTQGSGNEHPGPRRRASRSWRLQPLPLLGWVLVAALAAGPGWHFGGFGVVRWCWLAAAGGLALALAGPKFGLPTPRLPALALAPLALAGLGAAQLLPLPAGLRAALNPVADAEWKSLAEVLPAADLAEAPACLSLHPAGTRSMVALALLAAACVFLGAQFLRSTLALHGWFALTALVGVATALVGVTFLRGGPKLIYGSIQLTAGGQPFAGFVTRNHAGALLNMCMAGALAWSLRSWSRSRGEDPAMSWRRGRSGGGGRWESRQSPAGAVALLTVAGCALGLVACLSRGAWVGAVAGAVAAGFVHLHSRRRQGGQPSESRFAVPLALGGVVAVAALIVAVSGMDQRIGERLALRPDARWKHWQDMLPAVRAHGLAGAGLGAYEFLSRPYTKDSDQLVFQHAENSYLEMLIEGGGLGLALALAGLGLASLAVWRVAKQDDQRDGWALAVAGAYVVASQATQSLVDFALYIPANLILCALWLGAVAGRATRGAEDADGAFAKAWRSPWLGRAGAAALLAAAAWGAPQTLLRERVEDALLAERQLGYGVAVARAQDDAALARLEALAAAATDDGELRQYLAQRYVHRFRVDDLKESGLPPEQRALAFPLTSPETVNRKVSSFLLRKELLRQRQPKHVGESLVPAAAALRAALARCPLLPEPPLLLAELHWLDDDGMARQTKLLERAARVAPGSGQMHYRSGLCHFAADRRTPAAAHWRRALEIGVHYQARILALASSWFQPLALLDEVVPPTPQGYLAAAREWTGQSEFAKARLAAAERARAAATRDNPPDADRIIGEAQLIMGNPTLAAQHLNRHLSAKVGDADARMLLAQAYEKLDMLDDAIGQAETAKAYGGAARFEQLLSTLKEKKRRLSPR